MTNHPNRSRANSPASNPTPDEIKQARQSAGLTQAAAAKMVFSNVRTWERWESADRRMHPAIFDYFLIKTRQKTLEDL